MKGGFLEPAGSAGQPAVVPAQHQGWWDTTGRDRNPCFVEAEWRCKKGRDQLV